MTPDNPSNFDSGSNPDSGRGTQPRVALPGKIPTTIITGFLGAGKTTLLRHVLEQAQGRRLAIIVNEFGAVGIDGGTLRGCAIPSCPEENIVELANGCLCCTVADEFLPAMQSLLDRPVPPEHILIETSGLALPKPLLKAFDWPAVRSRVTVDGVIAVIDALFQREPDNIEFAILRPLRDAAYAADKQRREETAATRVEFFTMVRGED